ncbi:radical SAM protein [Treponema endosymbiont of Eucomonympha sp.]|uniref:radical SAM protein n=2 Tax=Treponema endosymbiont of Eucomonympha sp. TaxID=1580831 RepID=UPI000751246A|nr:radical SAM protein [Treponema endosymbiont of Eucomonympha sp.]
MLCINAGDRSARNEQFLHIANRHPCFSTETGVSHGRIHLPVSPACNIRCRFCNRQFNATEYRPGVSAELLKPQDAVALVRRALELCPEITVAGIAGPGDTLATSHALEAFQLIHREFPELINCLSTNGLLLERYADDIAAAGVRTLTVTVNAVDPSVLKNICAYIVVDGIKYEGIEGAEILIAAQKRGIRKAVSLGLLVKINAVLIPEVNGWHIAEIARTVRELGVGILNIIPLIPQYEFAGYDAPDCEELARAREAAEAYLPVFRHCQHCRADAVGVPGKNEFSAQLYGGREVAETFSHG